MSEPVESLQERNRRVIGKAVMVVFGMFAFGFLLVPLYDVFCEVTGLNGKTAGQFTGNLAAMPRDESRTIKVQFLTANNENMPWQFRPTVKTIRVQPGVETDVAFFAKNTTTDAMVAQAVPSVSPSAGAEYFLKTECFCFQQQPLEAGAEVLMNVRFLVDSNLPAEINTLTLSYTLFDITDRETKTRS